VRPSRGQGVDIGFQVVPAQIEREGPMDRAELAAIAAANGGQVVRHAGPVAAALEQIQSRSATDTFRTPHRVGRLEYDRVHADRAGPRVAAAQEVNLL